MRYFTFFDDFPIFDTTDTFVARIPGDILSVEDFFREVAIVLQFPEYFWHNWDAFEECVNDFSWTKEKNILLLHEHVPRISPSDQKTYLEILKEAQYDVNRHGVKNLEVYFPLEEKKYIHKILHR